MTSPAGSNGVEDREGGTADAAVSPGRPSQFEAALVFPAAEGRSAAAFLDDLGNHPPLEPFAPATVEFCARFADTLRRLGRGRGELQALAFWMRRAELVRLQDEFRALNRDGVILVPRGTVFHIPPANVDTIFVYSWLLAALVGNRNVIRLSQRRSDDTDLLLECLDRTAAALRDSPLLPRTAIVSYGHDDRATAELSAAADVRVVWGGDATVDHIRRFPLAPHAVELTFPDRSSLAVLSAAAVLGVDEPGLRALAERFFNDAYWFDQMGCSSPRSVVWVGDRDAITRATAAFYAALAVVVREKGYQVDARGSIDKLLFRSRAVLDERARGFDARSNELLVLGTGDLHAARGGFVGQGTFFDVALARLSDLAGSVSRRDQTITAFGFGRQELMDLVRLLNGRGVDRVVPVGEALTFDRIWDGHDLLQAFTRRVHVRVEGEIADAAGSAPVATASFAVRPASTIHDAP